MIKTIRSHLGVKLFLSYFAVILVGVLILALTVPAVLPQAFNRHLSNVGMSEMGMMSGSGAGQGQGQRSHRDERRVLWPGGPEVR